ncbi:MAG: spermidine synthase [Bradyrhizobium sp.]|nr:spermidine synthase [Bradyrhizobium sp.]
MCKIDNPSEQTSARNAAHGLKVRPLLGLFFLTSGMSSLLYQIAWQRLLGLFYGVGAVSSAIVIGAFLFGLGLGSLFGGQLGRRERTRTLITYMAIELGIGLFGIASIPLIGWLGELTAGADYWLAAVCIFCFLLFPTVLMGATLPVAIQVLQVFDRDLLRNVSSYYFMNTIGAAVGCLVAGTVLISLIGLDGTIYLAAFLNLLLAGAIGGLVRSDRQLHASDRPIATPVQVESMAPRLLYPAVFVSGFIAIGYEIIWFRIVGVLLKDSIYAFTIMLSVYLAAIALGSRHVHRIAKAVPWKGPRNCYLALNGIIALSVAGTVCAFYYLQGSLAGLGLDQLRQAPILPVPPQEWSLLAIGALPLNILACIGVAGFFIALPAYFMGATFPLLASLAPDAVRHPARAVSWVYATAVFGNLTGALVTGFVLLPVFGTERTMLFFVLAGLSFFIFLSREVPGKILYRLVAPAALVVVIFSIFPGPSAVIRALHVRLIGGTQYFAEGIEGVVLTHVDGARLRHFINGSAHGGRPNPMFYLEAIQTLSSVENPQNVLIIGLGTGSVLEAALNDPQVGAITVVEINATTIRNLRKIELIEAMLSHPKVTVFHDDARRWLNRTDRRFDVVMMDPLRTASAFSNNIYSREFFQQLHAHLMPGGAVMVWTDEYFVVPKTLAAIFPIVEQYCTYLIGMQKPVLADRRAARFESILAGFSAETQAAIRAIGCAQEFNRGEILNRTAAIPINTDHSPVTEYYLGSAVAKLLRSRPQ